MIVVSGAAEDPEVLPEGLPKGGLEGKINGPISLRMATGGNAEVLP